MTRVKKGDPQYLEPEADGVFCCSVPVPAPEAPAVCTRPIGHEGDHAAHGASGIQYRRWPQEKPQ